ncbi:MAG: biopolymer transporter ExbD [Deltaproteobacteria bacterium]|jgi:biopolymer transport protein ExbD/biopolymer transport protein TolR|nr:biopolymer transporter ExbD [Deltaproteobacteria bacterium]
MGFRRRPQESPHVDLTPMIDVVFLLLIFFMISTTFIERPGLNIDLPASSAQQVQQGKKEVQVYLAKNGDIYLQREPVNLNQLLQHLEAYGAAKAKTMTFLLMADKSALHGRVIELMDAAKLAGFGQLAIATEPQSETSASPVNSRSK